MNYYEEIKKKLIDDNIYSIVKDYSKERHNLITQYEVGKLLNEAGKQYGENIIETYSKKLTIDLSKKYNTRTLRRMRQLYQFFEKYKWSPVGTKLSISHIRQFFTFDDINKINYYADQIIKRNLSKRELEKIIKDEEYERLPITTKEKIISKVDNSIDDYIKNPIIIKNSNKYENISEKILQQMILEDIPSFLNELGSGYAFIKNEYRIKIGTTYNYIDLLLFNIEFNCYVVVELKVSDLKKEHIGQIQVYMNYIDKNLKTDNQNKTIGIILVRRDNKYIIEYSSDSRIISRTFELV